MNRSIILAAYLALCSDMFGMDPNASISQDTLHQFVSLRKNLSHIIKFHRKIPTKAMSKELDWIISEQSGYIKSAIKEKTFSLSPNEYVKELIELCNAIVSDRFSINKAKKQPKMRRGKHPVTKESYSRNLPQLGHK